ncbi:type IV pilus twitching motility protein PilT [Synechococcus sp. CS-1325]|uniref:type IV pilus twitching motility protein PilT n=1 Tax=unclassified Synechococcus TaxID=2626047 RepID=UPI000DB5C07C|nr:MULTISPECIES: type IV pilus twitching motility protein PilT [unclassified Synechococcus]PZU96591.1 MAG: twitching motility protein PilT [Cyanobium sp.]MCT0199165.1 type IV pilus twitching motility protein PilT [Synechococcus sp. CS-1325]MCT0214656.1 type IV pilus twitching motility protein PilT [Synechococcus sp. CS-1326]MCT0231154.1 type IV pilus twitching motility protein PilT [Synechococcus sp. CS-1324]MCT0233990.1 type IV pilus twitching motility protein PilT [Synechococcus sp. CS-1327]
MEVQIEELMEKLVQDNGSDLHLSAGQPPFGRFNGELRPMHEQTLTEEACNRMIFSILNNGQRKQLEQTWELDCSYGLRDLARFRVNVYSQKGTYAACLRALSSNIPTPQDLNLPPVVIEITNRPSGLVLITGPTGSGKSTTLASMLDHINHHTAKHIITIEDPIEFTYKSDRSLIHQRQVNEDTKSFGNALRAALREDPDVILVGELRDLETIQLAITAAETGHLVFATLHTSSASQTVDRMVDVFPGSQQTQVRVQLSGSLAAIFAQTLCRRSHPGRHAFGRVMAQEIMVNTPALANLVREGKTAQIYSQIQTGGQLGMQTMEKALANLVAIGDIELDEARSHSAKPEELNRLLVSGT